MIFFMLVYAHEMYNVTACNSRLYMRFFFVCVLFNTQEIRGKQGIKKNVCARWPNLIFICTHILCALRRDGIK